jgi:large subunit ribosomal protein L10
MNREQKAQAVAEIAAKIADSEAIYAADYRGLSVAQAAALRARLREADSSFRIVKNTLTLLAAEKAGTEQVKQLIEGPTAFTFVRGDPALAAKALDSFARQERVLDLRGGLVGGELMSGEAVRQLARLPGRDQLNAQLAGVVASPLTGLVRGLASLLSGLAVALGQIRATKEAEAPAGEPPTAAKETAVEEAPAAAVEARPSEDESSHQGAQEEKAAEAADEPATAPEPDPEAHANGQEGAGEGPEPSDEKEAE